MTAERWTIRGVASDLQRAVTEAARTEGRSVGGWVSNALRTALEGRPADGRQQDDTNLRAIVARLAERLAEVESRLDAAQSQTAGGQSADITAADAHATSQAAAVPAEPSPLPVTPQHIDDSAPALNGERRGLADSVKTARKAQGLSQRALADKAGVPQSEICKMERGTLRETHRSAEHIGRVRATLGLEG